MRINLQKSENQGEILNLPWFYFLSIDYKIFFANMQKIFYRKTISIFKWLKFNIISNDFELFFGITFAHIF